jgi:hypothetical protein
MCACTCVCNVCKVLAGFAKKLFTLLDLCVSSLRRGHANLLCIVPILTDDPRRESSASCLGMPNHHSPCNIHTQCATWRIAWGCPLARGGSEGTSADGQLGGITSSCHPSGSWSVKCMCSYHVLLAALMACPDQVGTPQGQHGVSCDVLVDNDRGIGSGWQQSKQNPAVSSVVG